MMRTRTPQKSNRKTTKKNNNFDIALAFLYISKPSLHDQYVKLPNYPS